MVVLLSVKKMVWVWPGFGFRLMVWFPVFYCILYFEVPDAHHKVVKPCTIVSVYFMFLSINDNYFLYMPILPGGHHQ